MDEKKTNRSDIHNHLMETTRKDFIKNMITGCGTAIIFGNFGCALNIFKNDFVEKQYYAMILVDYSKCTGCRTCEAVCSSFNHKVKVDGELLAGLGNPYYSNIRVHSYNPDVDIPAVCALCTDVPCIQACPVPPYPDTGRKALYRDMKLKTIKNDISRCIGCGNCEKACRASGAGIIIPNPKTGKPERICTLCDGDPQCVKHCPYDALAFSSDILDMQLYRMHPDKIAIELALRLYNIRV